jgi:hypothetical protein
LEVRRVESDSITYFDRFEVVHIESIAKLVDSSSTVESITSVNSAAMRRLKELGVRLTFYRKLPIRDDRL